MAIPIRNTTRTAAVKSAYGLSYINTPSGATISGETRQYNTYKEMVTDPSPTRLAAVLNASMDTDYPVPQEHRGGILFQYDSVNSTWVLLYTTEDLTVPTRINWPNILNVPKWVGGITNNRVKLTENRFAETRTTYYSYGDYILVLPDPDTVQLGDQIALEQYDGEGAICYPYIPSEASQYLIDITGGGSTSVTEFDASDNWDLFYEEQLHFEILNESATGNNRVWYTSDPQYPGAYVMFKFDTEVNRWAVICDCDINGTTDDVSDDSGYRRFWTKQENTTDPWTDTRYVQPDDEGGGWDAPVEEHEITFTIPESSDPELYHVEYTNADYVYTLDNEGHMVIDPTKPTNHHTYIFTCTETEDGERIWRMNADEDLSESLIDIRKEMVAHAQAWDPHHQYILKAEVGNYISSLIEVTYRLPEAESYRMGGVYMATMSDVLNGAAGAKVPNASILNTLLSSYAKVEHNHTIGTLADVATSSFVNGQVLVYDGSQWQPMIITASSLVYGEATTTSRGLVFLATSDTYTSVTSGTAGSDVSAHVVNCNLLNDVLADYTKTSDLHISSIGGVDITTMSSGNVLIVGSDNILHESPFPKAAVGISGIVAIAADSTISSGTTASDVAITPVQLMNFSSTIITAVADMMYNSGYVLPEATSTGLGGVRLINDSVLSLVMDDYPEFSSHSVASATVINPMQYVSYHHKLSSSVVSNVSNIVSNFSSALTSRVNNLDLSCAYASNVAVSAQSKVDTVSSALVSKFNALSSAIIGVKWQQGSTITDITRRMSAGDTTFFTAPGNGFIRFKSVPDVTNELFSAAVGPGGKFTAEGYIAGYIDGSSTDILVHNANGRVADNNGSGAYFNLNTDMIAVNTGDIVYYQVIASHNGSSSYLNFNGFEVDFFPSI